MLLVILGQMDFSEIVLYFLRKVCIVLRIKQYHSSDCIFGQLLKTVQFYSGKVLGAADAFDLQLINPCVTRWSYHEGFGWISCYIAEL